MNGTAKVVCCCRSAIGVLTVSLALMACQREQSAEATGAFSTPAVGLAPMPIESASGPKRSSQGRYSLGIVGYNYTETGIIDYSVNGTGAFNLAVSTEDSGGGSTVCCFGWAPAAKMPLPIRIEWTRDEQTWCRKTVMLMDPGPLEPTTLEVHFFPDRHIEVAITAEYSEPRLKLGRNGVDFRVAKDWFKEKQAGMAIDAEHAECRSNRFPIGG